jgi:phosphoglycolate phosphatase
LKRSVISSTSTALWTPPVLVWSFRRSGPEFGVPERWLARHRNCSICRPISVAASSQIRRRYVSHNEALAGYRQKVTAAGTNIPLALFPEVPAVLRSLSERGCSIVLTTNFSLESLDARLTAAGIREYFTLLLGTDPGSGMTKGPDHMRRAGAALGLSAQDLAQSAVLVGDMDHDMIMAREAGIVAIGRITDGNAGRLFAAGADHVIEDLLALEPLLARLEAPAN